MCTVHPLYGSLDPQESAAAMASRSQTTKRLTSVATGRIYTMGVMWPKILNITVTADKLQRQAHRVTTKTSTSSSPFHLQAF